eukprot:1160854-Pelagomonas_calceolata.AAC.1
MGTWRVAHHAPGRPDSPSPVLCRHAPSNPPLSKPPYGVRMLNCCTFESDERIRVRAEFQFNKVDVPVLRRDLGRIKVSLSA